VQWLRQNAACLEVERGMLLAGELGDALQQLWALPLPPRPDATGAVEAAEFLKATFFESPIDARLDRIRAFHQYSSLIPFDPLYSG